MSSLSPERRFETPAAFRDLWTPSRYKAFWGGRGGGKSRAFGRALLLKSLNEPLRILCAREIQKSISDSVKRLLDDDIERMGLSGFFDSTLSEIRTEIGGLFIFAGLRSNIETVKSTEGIDIAWLEEANAISQASMDILIPTIRKEGSEICKLEPEGQERPRRQDVSWRNASARQHHPQGHMGRQPMVSQRPSEGDGLGSPARP